MDVLVHLAAHTGNIIPTLKLPLLECYDRFKLVEEARLFRYQKICGGWKLL